MASATLPASTRHSLLLILLAFTGLALVYSWATPPLEGPDGPEHVAYVRWLAAERGLPPQGAAAWETPVRQEAGQPPLYYWLASWPLRLAGALPASEANPHFPSSAPGHVPDNKNHQVHDPTRHALADGWGPLYAVRLVSLAFGWLLVASVYALAREAVPASPGLAAVAALAVALNPQVLFLSGVVSNDIAAAALSGSVLWLLVRLWRRGPTPALAAGLGLAFGLATLAKSNTLLLAAPIALALALRWRRPGEQRRTLAAGLAAAFVAVLVAGWFYGRAWLLYGSPLGLDTHCFAPWAYCDAPAARPAGARWLEVFYSFWAAFGWGNIKPPGWVFLFPGLLVAAAGLGLVRAWRARVVDEPGPLLLLLALPLLLSAIALEAWMREVTAPHGRLLFPALAGVAVLLAVGWRALSPRTPAVALAGLAILSLGSLAGLILPAYRPPASLTPARLAARLSGPELGWRFGEATLLRGARLLAGDAPTTAGETLIARLCWEPLAQTSTHLSVFVHLVGPGDAVVASRRTYPGLGRNPTGLWAVGAPFCDDVRVDVPATLSQSLLYRVEVGLIDDASGERLPAFAPEGAPRKDTFAARAHLVTPDRFAPVPTGEGAIRLQGADLPPAWQAGGEAAVTLAWVLAERLERDLTVYVHLRDDQGENAAQADGPPVDGWYPTRIWSPGERVLDTHVFRLPDDIPSGAYGLYVGWYDAETEARLGPDHFLGLVTVR